MNPVFENMTQDENDFFERMKTAPVEQRDSFRTSLNQLMRCYGDNAPGAILASFIDRTDGKIYTSGINLHPEEMLVVAKMTLAVLEENVQAPEAPTH